MNPSVFQFLQPKSNYSDAGYLASNTPPQGEVWIRRSSVTSVLNWLLVLLMPRKLHHRNARNVCTLLYTKLKSVSLRLKLVVPLKLHFKVMDKYLDTQFASICEFTIVRTINPCYKCLLGSCTQGVPIEI